MSTAEADTREAVVTFSTGADVLRRGLSPDLKGGPVWRERLSVEGCRLDRIARDVCPFLVDHRATSDAQIGLVKAAKREGKALVATVQFGRGSLASEMYEDVKAKTRRGISVGYSVESWKYLGEEGGIRTYLADSWTVLELSLVPVPADPAARVRGLDNEGAEGAMHREVAVMEILTRSADTGAVHPAVVEDASRGQGVPDDLQTREGEVERVRAIRQLGDLLDFRRDDAVVLQAIGDGASVVEARRMFLDARVGYQRATGTSSGGAVDFRLQSANAARDALVNALAHRFNAAVPLESGQSYSRMSVLDMDREWGRVSGQRQSLQRSGMHTTTDFPLLLTQASQVALEKAVAQQPPALLAISRKITTADKTPFQVLRMSAAPELLPLNEAAESIRVATFARMLSFSRDLILSDRLGAFQDFIAMGARAANNKLGDLLHQALALNPVMSDGTPFFHANHGNLAASGTALDMANLESAVIALRSQKDIDGRPAGIVPAFLVVGPRREVAARRLVAEIQAGAAGDVNPYAGLLSVVVEDRVTGTEWYVGGSLATAPLGHVFLDGSRQMSSRDGVPLVDIREGWNVLGLEARIVQDAGAAPLDHKAIFKNPGN